MVRPPRERGETSTWKRNLRAFFLAFRSFRSPTNQEASVAITRAPVTEAAIASTSRLIVATVVLANKASSSSKIFQSLILNNS
jgi:hypothetical protein